MHCLCPISHCLFGSFTPSPIVLPKVAQPDSFLLPTSATRRCERLWQAVRVNRGRIGGPEECPTSVGEIEEPGVNGEEVLLLRKRQFVWSARRDTRGGALRARASRRARDAVGMGGRRGKMLRELFVGRRFKEGRGVGRRCGGGRCGGGRCDGES